MYSGRSNLILGFHGCDEAVRDILLSKPNDIQGSEKPYDWLGHGMYFWENNYARALDWAKDKAKRKEIKKASVIGAVLSLDYCLDLTDSRYIELIKVYYELMKSNYSDLGKDMPENKDAKNDAHKDKLLRELDCSVIEFMHTTILSERDKEVDMQGFSDLKIFDSARGVFVEGGPIYPGAGIQSKTHIQICIRNFNCIKGFFLPRNVI